MTSLISDVAALMDGVDWLMVGGNMVHQHCLQSVVDYDRHTDDMDVVVNSTIVDAYNRIAGAGFVPVIPVNHQGRLHRFQRGDQTIDLMVTDGEDSPRRMLGYRTVRCPGTRSAFGYHADGTRKEITTITMDNHQVRLPNLWSAAAIKGHAYRTPSLDKQRHVHDCLALIACISVVGDDRCLSKTERKAVNHVLSSPLMSELSTWEMIPEENWSGVVSTISCIRDTHDMRIPGVVTRKL